MKSVLILGSGNLGAILSESLNSYGLSNICLSVRSIQSPDSLRSVERVSTIIDCMDPSSNRVPFFSDIQAKISLIRSYLVTLPYFRSYFYVSSSNVYEPSVYPIDESSQLLQKLSVPLNSYIYGKVCTERSLQSKIGDRLTILRPVSLWSSSQANQNDGFFSDLFAARRLGRTLSPRDGDDNIFTFMSYFDAASIIIHLLLNSFFHHRILNITASIWSSRACLKQNIDFIDNPSVYGRRIISSIISDKLMSIPFTPLL